MTKLLLGLAALVSVSTATLGSEGQAEPQVRDGPFACLLQDLSPEDRRAEAMALATVSPEADAEAQPAPTAAVETIRAAAPRCVESAGWTERQSLMAFCYAHSQLTWEGIVHVYGARNVDLTELENAAAAVAAGPPGTNPPSANVLAATLQRQGLTEDESLDLVIRHAIVAGMAEGLKRNFADPALPGC